MTSDRKDHRPASNAMPRTLAVIFLAVLFILSIGTISNFIGIYREYIGEFHGLNNIIQALTFRDNKKALPPVKTESVDLASTATDVPSGTAPLSPVKNALNSLAPKFRFVKKVIFNIEDMYTRYFYALDIFVDGHGLANKLLGKSVIYTSPKTGYYRTGNEYLFPVNGTPVIPEEAESFTPSENQKKNIRDIVDFQHFLKERGTDFLFVIPAVKEYYSLQSALNGRSSERFYTVQQNSWFLNELSQNHISYVNCSEELTQMGVDIRDWFYRTDHHWRMDTGFQLMPVLLLRLRLIENGESVPSVEEVFEPRSKKHFFIGSTGRQVGRFFCRPDDFTYYLPKKEFFFRMDYIHRVTHDELTKEGSFEELIVTPNNIDPHDRYANRYGVYLGIDLPLVRLHNKTVTNDRKIVLVKTSHAVPIIAFLSLFVRDLIIVDFRHLRKDEGTLSEIVAKENPDTVLMVYPTGSGIDQIRF